MIAEQIEFLEVPLKGFEDKYRVRSNGEIISHFRGKNKLLKLATSIYGLKNFGIKENGRQKRFIVHNLIAEYFIDNPFNFTKVDHKDGDRSNNDISNLEWVRFTRRELNFGPTKICHTCKIEKERTSEFFYIRDNVVDGLEGNCKECRNIAVRKSQKRASPEQKSKVKIKKKIFNKTLRGHAGITSRSYRSIDKKFNRENDITTDDVLEVRTKKCIYCGYPAVGFDRVDNKKGHIKSNSVPCCLECNIARMDNFTHQETFILGEAIKRIKDKRLKLENE